MGTNWFINENDPEKLGDDIKYVDKTVDMILEAGLGVIIDPLHNSDNSFESKLAKDPEFITKVEKYWSALAKRYRDRDADRVFFEVMNEPHMTDVSGISKAWWPPVQERLEAAIRQAAPDNTIIVTGEDWGSTDGLKAIKPLADKNVLYSFHFYEPFYFTHQGADWTADDMKNLSNIPYPSSPEAVQPVLKDIKDQKIRDEIEWYGSEKWNIDKIDNKIKDIYDWAQTNNVKLFCGEFGSYKPYAPEASRIQWILDASGRRLKSMESDGQCGNTMRVLES